MSPPNKRACCPVCKHPIGTFTIDGCRYYQLHVDDGTGEECEATGWFVEDAELSEAERVLTAAQLEVLSVLDAIPADDPDPWVPSRPHHSEHRKADRSDYDIRFGLYGGFVGGRSASSLVALGLVEAGCDRTYRITDAGRAAIARQRQEAIR